MVRPSKFVPSMQAQNHNETKQSMEDFYDWFPAPSEMNTNNDRGMLNYFTTYQVSPKYLKSLRTFYLGWQRLCIRKLKRNLVT